MNVRNYRRAVTLAALLAATAIPVVSWAASCENVLDSSQDTQIFAAVVRQAGLLQRPTASGTVTIFAPTDAAMRSDTAMMQMMSRQGRLSPAELAELRQFAEAHIVSGARRAADMRAGARMTTLAGTSVTLQGQAPSAMTLRSSGGEGAHLAGMQAGADARMAGDSKACDSGVVIPIDHPLITLTARPAGPFTPEAAGSAAGGPQAAPNITAHQAGPFTPEAGRR